MIKDRIKEFRRVLGSELIDNDKNWREHPPSQQTAMLGVLEEVGIADVLLVRETPEGLQLIDGHLRRNLEPDVEWPCAILDVDDVEADVILATHDPLAAMAETNDEMLADLLDGLDADSEELQKMLDDLRSDVVIPPEIKQDIVPEPPVDPITKPGDLWLLGDHRLLCGDSTKAEDVERLMDGEKADLCLTDPPYGMGGYAGRSGNHDSVIGDDLSISDFLPAIPESRAVWIWCDWRSFPTVCEVRGNPDALIVWVKEWQTMGCGYRHRHEFAAFYGSFSSTTETDVIENAYREDGIRSTWQRTKNMQDHPTQKPVACMGKPITNHTITAEMVYDPFVGSGTTIIAAEQLGRRCYAMEISPQYCDVSVKRWENLAGKKAMLDGQS